MQPFCMHGQAITGHGKRSCQERSAPNSVLCPLHLAASLARVRASRDERTALLVSLRWTGLTAPARRVWA